MASLLFQATSITLLLLPFLSISTSFLVDTDNDPIANGKTYYIVPVGSETGGLTYTQKKHACPLYITPEKSENSSGTPVRISSPARTLYISVDERVTLEFDGSTPCDESRVWTLTIDPLARAVYVTTGGDTGARSFSITKRDKSLKPTYELKYWVSNEEDSSSSNVGLYENGLLGVTEYSDTVSFKKAFDVLELSTS